MRLPSLPVLCGPLPHAHSQLSSGCSRHTDTDGAPASERAENGCTRDWATVGVRWWMIVGVRYETVMHV
jgi:hypothetical protein